MFGWLMCLGSWLLERGLAQNVYRRLGSVKAYFQTMSKSSCSTPLKQFHQNLFDQRFSKHT